MSDSFAEGTRELDPQKQVDSQPRTFQVRIYYREPEYERRNGAKREPYRHTFAVCSVDAEAAARAAVAEFRQIQRQSSVGWIREIVDIQVLGGE